MDSLSKFPTEELTFTFDFSARAEIVSGQSLTGTPEVVASLRKGGGELVIGTPSVAGDGVDVVISGGDEGDVFVLVCTVDTDAGMTLAAAGTLNIKIE